MTTSLPMPPMHCVTRPVRLPPHKSTFFAIKDSAFTNNTSSLNDEVKGKEKKPATMSDDDWSDLDEKALTAVQLCLSNDVLQEVISEKTTAGLWNKLEELYLTKFLANRLILKQRLYTLRMAEGTSIKSHISEFSSIITDLSKLDYSL
ncbi:Retrovirus-related Pol polyprotein from transposon TNT 1-94 [Senna tora]|uniref:Retrovirus-related Pol polyprotein from transposon TNT 1-94 n=1 Tax=Senna tora TaxID=362788 RepID=A0A834WYM8_9FABA|nr:Retrovirus-related Pol polyprotein from transposon TNT 1-94 [Senna tora]